MDERVARIKTSKDALQLAENALRLGHPDVHAQALERAKELRAIEEGFISPAERAIAGAIYAYEEERRRVEKNFRAKRTWKMVAEHGAIAAAERKVLDRKPSKGYEVLKGAGLGEQSFEAIIDRFPDEFSSGAVEAARARLKGESPPRVSRRMELSDHSPNEPGDTILSTVALDAEAQALLNDFRAPDGWFLTTWLPNYRESIQAIEKALEGGRPQDLFEMLWKRRDNWIANAGVGLLKHAVVDEIREELVQVIRDIHDDGSPANFERIVERFEGWKAEGRINKVPRVLIGRAFAGVHPSRYHTTVDASRHNRALKWFAKHSGFAIPSSIRWAVRAKALVDHLDRTNLFGDDIFTRNIFPWFVVVKLGTRSEPTDVPPGHTPRPHGAFADLPPAQRAIALRHNIVQTELFNQLAKRYGEDRVWTEYPTGTGGYADAIVRPPDGGCFLYEIKIADTSAEVVRQAMGQLLEYGFRTGGLEPERLFVVGERVLDNVTRDFIERLRNDFNLDIEYLRIELPEEGASSS
ncbi:hypothetical protein [Pandoraea sp. 64-18]|uniref:hypothetical protein n=1 Tax=Pandoraea sp. 64-18 TaxID=1895806 RepID=UPI000966C87A|nr:hypothetical protein [Pandoraea sp. 64-18]OJY17825.1 MAG: hypothetical protein BGP02_06255 [Pandoraea sp. 64-18]